MNPWKIIGWIVLIPVVLVLGTCGLFLIGAATDVGMSTGASPSTTTRAESRPTLSAALVSESCELTSSGAFTEATYTIRNTSGRVLEYVQAFIKLGDSVDRAYFSPTTIPAGSVATAKQMSRGRMSCQLFEVQARDGSPVKLTR